MLHLHRILLISSFLFCIAFCYKIVGDDDVQLMWPENYHFKGEKISLTSGIKEPFEYWYSNDYNKSRVDYYGGTVKMFYYGDNETDMGYVYMINPETTEEETNKIVCNMAESFGSARNFLPDVDEYEFVGTDEVNGREAQKWSYTVDDDEKKVVKNLWVVNTEEKSDEVIPVRQEVLMYDSWVGGLAAHELTDFYDYHADFTEEDLDAENGVDCIDVGNLEADSSKTLMFYDVDNEGHIDQVFDRFKNKHEKQYKDHNEHQNRRRIFRNNLDRIISRNRQGLSYKLGLNHLADRTKEELRLLASLKPGSRQEHGTVKFPYTEREVDELVKDSAFPKEVDLRAEGFVTTVKNQASCGSCWAFSTVAALEGALARSNGGRLINLSEQSLVDCAWGFGNSGCDGGLLDGALKWAVKHGVPTTEEYGLYTERNGYCGLENMTDLHTFSGFGKVTPYSESALKVAVYNHGPVAVAIHASEDMFLYESGIFYDPACKGEDVNHGVTVVGYGEQYGENYWIVKNSLGYMWGQEGYIMLSMKDDICLTESEPYFPVV